MGEQMTCLHCHDDESYRSEVLGGRERSHRGAASNRASCRSCSAEGDSPTRLAAENDRVHSLERRATAHLEQVLRTVREGDQIEDDVLVGLAWEYFSAGFAAGAFEATRNSLTLDRAQASSITIAGAAESREIEIAGAEPDLEELTRPRPMRALESETSEMNSLASLVADLTPRRIEVLRLVAKGLTNREIGDVLGISSYTVKSHIAGVLEALDLSNRTEAAVALREYEAERGAALH
jgi:DNA-binding NarL/FixJ family response regulator